MKKTRTEIEDSVGFRPGGTDRAMRELAEAAHRLTLRRLRDSLPGKIVTRRLVLRAPIRGDVPELVRLANNRNIADKLARMPHPYTGADALGLIEIIAQRGDERVYAITLDGRLIGVAGFSFTESEPPDFGYWLGEEYWGRGLMTEAGRGLIEAAHRTGHFERIAARVLDCNAASLGVLDRLGFRPTGTASATVGGKPDQPVIQLELERPRWM